MLSFLLAPNAFAMDACIELVTPRLVLKNLTAGDVQEATELLSQPQMYPLWGGLTSVEVSEISASLTAYIQQEEWAAYLPQNIPGAIPTIKKQLVLTVRQDDKLIGLVGFYQHEKEALRQLYGLDVSRFRAREWSFTWIAIDPRVMRLGFGLEAAQAAIGFVFKKGVPGLFWEVLPNNQPSINLGEKIGFRRCEIAPVTLEGLSCYYLPSPLFLVRP